ncbi:MAG: L-rhamnose/proton symporter RhaT [Pseudomonadota bacterium]
METIMFALAMVLIAGFINGSFPAPMKYMTKWDEENIWLIFSFFGFIILPWLTIMIMAPDAIGVLKALPPKLFWTIILGGIGFGLGQIAFALSFRYIGIGLAFVINISMGTSGSALIPILWHKGIMGTPYSYAQIAGIVVFVIAVIIGAAAGAARDKAKKQAAGTCEEGADIKRIKPGKLLLGVVLAMLAGAGSVSQGVTYIWANPTVSALATNQFGVGKLASGVIAWVIIFCAAFIPYFLYFLILNFRNKSFAKLKAAGSSKYWYWIILMGVGYWGSLVFFSKASEEIGGDLAPTIAWPLFMVFIILTSNFWSWKSREWEGAGKSAARKMWVSLSFFVVAILVFSYSSKLEPPNPQTPDDHYHDVHYKHIKHDNYPVYEHKVQKPETETEDSIKE